MPLAAQRRILRVVLHASNGYALKSAREVLEGVCKIDPKAAEKVFIEEHTEYDESSSAMLVYLILLLGRSMWRSPPSTFDDSSL